MRPVKEAVLRVVTATKNSGEQVATAVDKLSAWQEKREERESQRPKIKHPEPESFDGKSENVLTFLATLRLYFRVTKEQDPRTQVAYALGKIKGGKDDCASKWAATNRKEWLEAEERDEEAETLEEKEAVVWPFKSYKDFETSFKNNFLLFDAKDTAKRELEKLKMTGTCEDYTRLFNTYAKDAEYDDEYLVYKYQQGLKEALRSRCMGTWPTPETLEEWKERAMKFDKVYRRDQEWKKDSAPTYRPQPKVTIPRRDPNAMEIDSITIEERKQLMSEGKCFYCREKGHMSRACPKKNQNTGRPTNTRTINNANVDGTDKVMGLLAALSDEDREKVTAKWNSQQGF
ncbi:hypothetical protein DFP72DRAFT_830182 [Ephemerocybe angulata]|uniref:CCHC-type domain-containing protein n=1 Tax=Ephemerocybe angulata TaxID=980116 RepID=A0A8H6HBC1_9AGAR|nr:hypothetical protein DFP72DRAFT_830182 [Tulosesus angulatus]